MWNKNYRQKEKNSPITGRQNARNVIRTKPGLSNFLSNVHGEMDAFSILLTNEMFENIIRHINKRITNTLEKLWDLKRQLCK